MWNNEHHIKSRCMNMHKRFERTNFTLQGSWAYKQNFHKFLLFHASKIVWKNIHRLVQKSLQNLPSKLIHSYATYKNLQSRFKKWTFYSSLRGFIDVGMLGENHQKNQPCCGQESSLKWMCCPTFVDHFLHRLVEHRDPQFIIMCAQSWCSSWSILAILLRVLLWMAKVVLFCTSCHIRLIASKQ